MNDLGFLDGSFWTSWLLTLGCLGYWLSILSIHPFALDLRSYIQSFCDDEDVSQSSQCLASLWWHQRPPLVMIFVLSFFCIHLTSSWPQDHRAIGVLLMLGNCSSCLQGHYQSWYLPWLPGVQGQSIELLQVKIQLFSAHLGVDTAHALHWLAWRQRHSCVGK